VWDRADRAVGKGAILVAVLLRPAAPANRAAMIASTQKLYQRVHG
jgi:hypothetical protein